MAKEIEEKIYATLGIEPARPASVSPVTAEANAAPADANGGPPEAEAAQAA